MAADTQTLQYIITFKTIGVQAATQAIKSFQSVVGAGEVTAKKVTASNEGMGLSIVKLASRAAITIPIWLAMRTAFMETLRTIGDGAKYIVEFDTAMRHMAAVSSEVANMPVFMKQLGKEVQQLSSQTGKSIKDVSDIYYQFAETGMKATDAQAGMTVALKLAIGTFGSAKETGRIMVDLYNMFGSSMGNAMTPMQKMESIAGTFVTLWKENSGSLDEYINSLKMFVPIAKMNNLTMKETLTTVVVLNNYMQRGSTGGTQLARAFQEMAKNASKFDAVGINIRNRTDGFKMFMEVLNKLNATPVGTNRNSLINSLFGERSQRSVAVLSLTDGLEKLGAQMNKLNAQDLAGAQKALYDAYELQNRSLSTQVQVFDQLRRQAGAAFLIGIMGASDYEDAILKAGDALRGLNDIMTTKVIPGLKVFGTVASIAFKTATSPIVLMTTAVAILAFNLSRIPLLLTAIGTMISAHPILALISAMAAITATAVAWENIQAAKKQGTLNDISTKLKEGMPLEEARKLAPAPSTVPSKVGNWVSKQVGKMFGGNPFAGGVIAESAGFLASKAVQKLDPRKPVTVAEIDQLAKNIKDQKELEAIEKKKADIAQQTAELESLTLKEKLAMANQMKAYGYDALTIEMRKYQIMKDEGLDIVKLREQELKILEEQIKVVNEMAGIMSDKLTGAFTGILSGTEGFSSIGKAISDSIVQGTRQTIAEGLTNMVMSSGIGEMFGISMSGLKGIFTGLSGGIEGAFEVGGKVAYDWIVKAFGVGISTASGGGTTGTAYMAGAAVAGMSGARSASGALGALAGGFSGLPLFSYGGGESMTNGIPTGGVGQYVKGGAGKQVTLGQLGGSAMTGFGMYQSTRQAGGSKGASLTSGILGGIGALGAGIGMLGVMGAAGGIAAAGGMASMGGLMAAGAAMGPIGWIGVGLLASAIVISMLASAKGKKTSQTQVQTETNVNSVASKIDVSNKKLELINRNLVALRNTMETYIMPTSTYFSTARNLEDEFALSARRG